jgi:serine/threonine-protein kinase
VVYRAWDRELNRWVAVKILNPRASMSETSRLRFRREAQAAASLAHPNLVTVFDAGEHDGKLFLIMELVEGQALRAKMEGRTLDTVDLVRILEKAARGVSAAHAKGVVHRDLKPANILLTAAGEPKVGDFGLAHLLDGTSELTRTGAALGTPLYMAPEQVVGRAREVTPRTDVYALGAVLFETLTGRPPFLAETLHGVYEKILRETPPSPRTINPRLSKDLDTIVLKALEKDPARRYASAGELAEDLRRTLEGEPIEARPVPMPVRAWRRLRKRPVLVLLAAGVVVAAGAAAFGIMSSKRAAAQRTALEDRSRERERVVLRAQAAREAIEAATRCLYEKSSSPSELHSLLEEAERRALDVSASEPRPALIWLLLGRVAELRGDVPDDFYRRAIAADSELGLAHFHLGRAFALRAAGLVEMSPQGETPAGAGPLLQAAASSLDESLKEGRGLDGIVREIARGWRAYARGDRDAARAANDRAVKAYPGQPGLEDLNVIVGLLKFGDKGMFVQWALDLRPKYPELLLWRAHAQLKAGKRETAVWSYREAADLVPSLDRSAPPGLEVLRMERDSRRLLLEAERDYQNPAATAVGVGKFRELASRYSDATGLAPYRDLIKRRASGGVDVILFAEDLTASGACRLRRGPPRSFWTLGDGPGKLSADLSLLQDRAYRAWALVNSDPVPERWTWEEIKLSSASLSLERPGSHVAGVFASAARTSPPTEAEFAAAERGEPSDASPPLLDSALVLHLPFDDGSGATTQNACRRVPDGVLVGAATFSSEAAPLFGRNAGSLSLDGKNGHVEVPDDARLNVAKAFTVACWVRRSKPGMWNAVYLSGNQMHAWALELSNRDIPHFVELRIQEHNAGVRLADTDWHHLAAVKDGDGPENLRIYVDGRLDRALSVGTVTWPRGPKRIGGLDGNMDPFAGNLDDFRFYTRALSGPEIAFVMSGRKVRYR